MLEALAAAVLNRVLGEYIEGVEGEQLRVGLLSGSVSLANVRLRTGALDRLQLPLEVRRGFLGCLQLAIPWRALKSQPVRVVIKDLFVLAVPAAETAYNAQREEERALRKKRERVEAAELYAVARPGGSSGGTFATQLAAKMVENLQLSIENVHVRVEARTPGRAPIAVGVTMRSVTGVSADAQWKEAFVSGGIGGVVRKILALDGLSLYWDAAAALTPYANTDAFVRFCRDWSAVSSDAVMLQPVSAIARLSYRRDRPPPGEPRSVVELLLPNCALSVSLDQWEQILFALASMSCAKRALRYRKYKRTLDTPSPVASEATSVSAASGTSLALSPEPQPTPFDPAGMLAYGLRCILGEVRVKRKRRTWDYVFQRAQWRQEYAALLKQQTPDESRIDALERQMDLNEILRVRAMVRRENATKTQLRSLSSTLWGFLGYAPAGDAVPDKELDSLYTAIDYKATATSALPDGAVLAHIAFRVVSGAISLKDGEAAPVTLSLTDLEIDVTKRPKSVSVSVSVPQLVAQQHLIAGFEEILRVTALSLTFDTQQHISIRASSEHPLALVHSPPAAEAIKRLLLTEKTMRHMRAISAQTGLSTKKVAAKKVDPAVALDGLRELDLSVNLLGGIQAVVVPSTNDAPLCVTTAAITAKATPLLSRSLNDLTASNKGLYRSFTVAVQNLELTEIDAASMETLHTVIQPCAAALDIHLCLIDPLHNRPKFILAVPEASPLSNLSISAGERHLRVLMPAIYMFINKTKEVDVEISNVAPPVLDSTSEFFDATDVVIPLDPVKACIQLRFADSRLEYDARLALSVSVVSIDINVCPTQQSVKMQVPRGPLFLSDISTSDKIIEAGKAASVDMDMLFVDLNNPRLLGEYDGCTKRIAIDASDVSVCVDAGRVMPMLDAALASFLPWTLPPWLENSRMRPVPMSELAPVSDYVRTRLVLNAQSIGLAVADSSIKATGSLAAASFTMFNDASGILVGGSVSALTLKSSTALILSTPKADLTFQTLLDDIDPRFPASSMMRLDTPDLTVGYDAQRLAMIVHTVAVLGTIPIFVKRAFGRQVAAGLWDAAMTTDERQEYLSAIERPPTGMLFFAIRAAALALNAPSEIYVKARNLAVENSAGDAGVREYEISAEDITVLHRKLLIISAPKVCLPVFTSLSSEGRAVSETVVHDVVASMDRAAYRAFIACIGQVSPTAPQIIGALDPYGPQPDTFVGTRYRTSVGFCNAAWTLLCDPPVASTETSDRGTPLLRVTTDGLLLTLRGHTVDGSSMVFETGSMQLVEVANPSNVVRTLMTLKADIDEGPDNATQENASPDLLSPLSSAKPYAMLRFEYLVALDGTVTNKTTILGASVIGRYDMFDFFRWYVQPAPQPVAAATGASSASLPVQPSSNGSVSAPTTQATVAPRPASTNSSTLASPQATLTNVVRTSLSAPCSTLNTPQAAVAPAPRPVQLGGVYMSKSSVRLLASLTEEHAEMVLMRVGAFTYTWDGGMAFEDVSSYIGRHGDPEAGRVLFAESISFALEYAASGSILRLRAQPAVLALSLRDLGMLQQIWTTLWADVGRYRPSEPLPPQAASVLVAGSGGVEMLRLLLLDDTEGYVVPLCDVQATELRVSIERSKDVAAPSWEVRATFEANTYNLALADWEPLLEAWACRLVYNPELHTWALDSEAGPEFVATESFLRRMVALRARASVIERKVYRDLQPPFHLVNLLDRRVTLLSDRDASRNIELESGQSATFSFEEWRELRTASTLLERAPTVTVAVEGGYEPIAGLAIQRIGSQTLALRGSAASRTVYMHVQQLGGARRVVFRERVVLHNDTDETMLLTVALEETGRSLQVDPRGGSVCVPPEYEGGTARLVPLDEMARASSDSTLWASGSPGGAAALEGPGFGIAQLDETRLLRSQTQCFLWHVVRPDEASRDIVDVALTAPLILCSLCPFDVEVQISQGSVTRQVVRVPAGCAAGTAVYFVDTESSFATAVAIPSLGWYPRADGGARPKGHRKAPSVLDSRSVALWTTGRKRNVASVFLTNDTRGHLVMQVVRTLGPRGETALTVVPRYVVVNEVGATLQVRSSSMSDQLFVVGPAGEDTPAAAVFSHVDTSAEHRVAVRMLDTEWGGPISFEAAGTTLHVDCRSNLTPRWYNLSVSVSTHPLHDGHSRYSTGAEQHGRETTAASLTSLGTLVVRIAPRIVLVNTTDEVLSVTDGRSATSAAPGAQVALHVDPEAQGRGLRLRLGADGAWSAPFGVLDAGSLYLRRQTRAEAAEPFSAHHSRHSSRAERTSEYKPSIDASRPDSPHSYSSESQASVKAAPIDPPGGSIVQLDSVAAGIGNLSLANSSSVGGPLRRATKAGDVESGGNRATSVTKSTIIDDEDTPPVTLDPDALLSAYEREQKSDEGKLDSSDAAPEGTTSARRLSGTPSPVLASQPGMSTGLLRVSRVSREPALFVAVSYSSFWPFVVRNTCAEHGVTLQQRGADARHYCGPQSSLSYAWDAPMGERVLMVAVGVSGRPFALNVSALGKRYRIKVPRGDGSSRVGLDLAAEGPVVVLRFSDALPDGKTIRNAESSQTLPARPAEEAEEALDAETSSQAAPSDEVRAEYTLRLPSVGLSLAGGPCAQEILYVHLRDVSLRHSVSDAFVTWGATVGWAQVDNQLFDWQYPLLLFPTNLRRGGESDDPPFVSLGIIRAERDAGGRGFTHYRYAAALVQEFSVELGSELMGALLGMYSRVAAGDPLLASPARPVTEAMAPGKPPRFEAARDSSDVLFFELLQLHPLRANVTLARADGGDRSAEGAPLIMTLGVTDAPLKLNALIMENVLVRQAELLAAVADHVRSEAKTQLLSVLFSINLMGNMRGLASSIGEGVTDLFYEPYQGLVSDRPTDLGIGIARGTKSLGKKLVVGVSGTLAAFTTTAAGGMSMITFDRRFQQARRVDKARNRPAHFGAGLAMGILQTYRGFKSGITGLVTKPKEGAQTGGIGGFFRGIGHGVVGLVTKPATGILDLTGSLLEGLRNQADDRFRTVTQTRVPRVVRPDGRVERYDIRAAIGQSLLADAIAETDGADAVGFREFYLGHVDVPAEGAVAVASSKRVAIISVERLRRGVSLGLGASDEFTEFAGDHASVLWQRPVERIASISVREEGAVLGLQSSGSGSRASAKAAERVVLCGREDAVKLRAWIIWARDSTGGTCL